MLSFEKQKFECYDDIYDHQVEGLDKQDDVRITAELIDDDPDGTEGMTALPDVFESFKDDSPEEKRKC